MKDLLSKDSRMYYSAFLLFMTFPLISQTHDDKFTFYYDGMKIKISYFSEHFFSPPSKVFQDYDFVQFGEVKEFINLENRTFIDFDFSIFSEKTFIYYKSLCVAKKYDLKSSKPALNIGKVLLNLEQDHKHIVTLLKILDKEGSEFNFICPLLFFDKINYEERNIPCPELLSLEVFIFDQFQRSTIRVRIVTPNTESQYNKLVIKAKLISENIEVVYN